MPSARNNCYDYPQYWDLAFRDETRDEADFIEAAASKYCQFPVQRVLEPGCGGGRLIVEMAARGYVAAGFDLSQPAIDYLKRRLKRRGLTASVFLADMASYRHATPVDLAFNTMNTFRHLTSEQAAIGHLKCIAASLRTGGVYVLGFHLLPPDADLEDQERWTARHGQAKVTMSLRVIEASRRTRLETLRFCMRVRSGTRDRRFRSDYVMRMYTARQFRSLLRKVPEFELVEVFDFCYEIDEPQKLDDQLGDAVFVLRKRRAA